MFETIPLAYMGFSCVAIIEILKSNKFSLKAVICPEDRVNDDILNLCNHSVKLITVSSKKDIPKAIKNADVSTFLMYKFPIIIPDEVCLNYNVFNIHPGDLRHNRGAHPIIWSILNGDSTTKMTLYKLKIGIDLGQLIYEYELDISSEDDSITLENKLEKSIPSIIDKLYDQLTNNHFQNVVDIEKGTYLRKINETDYTINLETDSLENISRKIRSQRKFEGAILFVNNNKFFVNGFDYTNNTQTISFTTTENETIRLKKIIQKEVEMK